jgi:hypothetical protein
VCVISAVPFLKIDAHVSRQKLKKKIAWTECQAVFSGCSTWPAVAAPRPGGALVFSLVFGLSSSSESPLWHLSHQCPVPHGVSSFSTAIRGLSLRSLLYCRHHSMTMGPAGGSAASFTYRKETLSSADFHALTRSLRQELDIPVRAAGIIQIKSFQCRLLHLAASAHHFSTFKSS